MMGPMGTDVGEEGREARRVARRRRRVDRRIRFLVRVLHLATVPFVRYDIRGGARVHSASNLIIVGNHRSLLDFIAGLHTSRLFGYSPRVLIAREFAHGRWTGPTIRWMGAIPVSSGGRRAEALEDGIAALRSGLSTVVMPEGRLHRDSDNRLTVGEGRTGVSRLAVGSDVPVLPAAVLGADRAWPPDRIPRLNPFRRRLVAIQVADEPLRLEGDDHRANTDLVMDAIAAELARAGEAHPELL
jgi:1-acyl-sn-glycerol-3-phosphate acyltransferase